MSAVAQYDRLVELAQSMSYQIRYENLGGAGGGLCEFGGRRILFVDLSLSLLDQIEQMQNALNRDASLPAKLAPSQRVALGLPSLPGANTSVNG